MTGQEPTDQHRCARAAPSGPGARGAMDSAPDFESGGCGFESRRACNFFWCDSIFCWCFMFSCREWAVCRFCDARANTCIASIAQLAEHALRKRKVASSILAGGWMGRWSRGMILPSGGRGRGFDSRTAPCARFGDAKTFYFLFFSKK